MKVRTELLRKYNVPGPRYTSYPTVPYWEHTPTQEEWVESLRFALQEADSKGIGAALLMANLQATLRARMPLEGDLSRLARKLDDELEAGTPARTYVTLFMGVLARFVHVNLHTRVACEVALDVLRRQRARDAELATEAERTHAIDQPEVDGLGAAPLIIAHLTFGHLKNF